MTNHDWIDDLVKRVREAEDKAREEAWAQAAERDRFSVLIEQYVKDLLATGIAIATEINTKLPRLQAAAEESGNAITFRIGTTGITFQFTAGSKSTHVTRFDAQKRGSGGGPSFTEVDGRLLLDNKTAEQFADDIFQEIAKKAVPLGN